MAAFGFGVAPAFQPVMGRGDIIAKQRRFVGRPGEGYFQFDLAKPFDERGRIGKIPGRVGAIKEKRRIHLTAVHFLDQVLDLFIASLALHRGIRKIDGIAVAVQHGVQAIDKHLFAEVVGAGNDQRLAECFTNLDATFLSLAAFSDGKAGPETLEPPVRLATSLYKATIAAPISEGLIRIRLSALEPVRLIWLST